MELVTARAAQAHDDQLVQEAALAEFVATLEAHVDNSIRLGKYLEAEIARRVPQAAGQREEDAGHRTPNAPSVQW
jgi:hypothetical protein